jgi:hypothetical protein
VVGRVGFRAEGVTDDDMTEYLIAFGCYVGEILTRHVGGAWRNDTAAYPTTVPLVGSCPTRGSAG